MFCIHKIIGSSPITSKNQNFLKNYKLKPSRLYLYRLYILNFDQIDQNLNTNDNFTKLNINVQTDKLINISKFAVLILGFLLEVLLQQRFFIKIKKNQKKSKLNNCFKISLHKTRWLIFLDIYLNSIFLDNKNNLNFSYEKVLNKIHFFILHCINNNLNLLNLNLKRIKIIVNSQKNLLYLGE